MRKRHNKRHDFSSLSCFSNVSESWLLRKNIAKRQQIPANARNCIFSKFSLFRCANSFGRKALNKRYGFLFGNGCISQTTRSFIGLVVQSTEAPSRAVGARLEFGEAGSHETIFRRRLNFSSGWTPANCKQEPASNKRQHSTLSVPQRCTALGPTGALQCTRPASFRAGLT